MTHRRKVARRKPWKRKQALYKKYTKEVIDWLDLEMSQWFTEEIDKYILRGVMGTPPPAEEARSLLGISNCLPSGDCGCIGHRMPNVYHIKACCDKPHITVEEFERLSYIEWPADPEGEL
jgi:hypothetical protein